MILHKQWRSALFATLLAAAALSAATGVLGQDSPLPKPVYGPRLDPPAIENTSVIDSNRIYNDIILPRLPKPAMEADIEDDGRGQAAPGQGVRPGENGAGAGITLYREANVCNDFNSPERWASLGPRSTDIWSDHYAGWGPFAADDGGFYRSDNVVFALEQVVGPGDKQGAGQFSAKLASSQPYAAGLGSPRISVPPGATVDIRVKYLIFDHDNSGQDFDWASLGVKPNADSPGADYVNGYVRGEWAELHKSIIAGDSGKIMVLLQAQSPAAINSNVYLDDVMISVDGNYLTDCTLSTD